MSHPHAQLPAGPNPQQPGPPKSRSPSIDQSQPFSGTQPTPQPPSQYPLPPLPSIPPGSQEAIHHPAATSPVPQGDEASTNHTAGSGIPNQEAPSDSAPGPAPLPSFFDPTQFQPRRKMKAPKFPAPDAAANGPTPPPPTEALDESLNPFNVKKN